MTNLPDCPPKFHTRILLVAKAWSSFISFRWFPFRKRRANPPLPVHKSVYVPWVRNSTFLGRFVASSFRLTKIVTNRLAEDLGANRPSRSIIIIESPYPLFVRLSYERVLKCPHRKLYIITLRCAIFFPYLSPFFICRKTLRNPLCYISL